MPVTPDNHFLKHINLEQSYGPYLVDNDQGTYFDGGGQIATQAIGVNHAAHFGLWHIDLENSEVIESLKNSWCRLLEREYQRPLTIELCQSGAEANEIALGHAFKNCQQQNAKKIMSFEGAFHGRTFVTLNATWNIHKRTPFLSDQIPVTFAKYPKTEDESKTCLSYLEQEFESLEYFAIILEPMQSEGGENYSPISFHQQLRELTLKYGIALIYDEVQTGLYLSGTVFWHQKFDLPSPPDYFTVAKKAQVGICLTPANTTKISGNFSATNLWRGYCHLYALAQSREKILQIENLASNLGINLINKSDNLVTRYHNCGLAFAFFSQVDRNALLQRLREHHFIAHPTGEKGIRLRFTLCLTTADFELIEQVILNSIVDKDNHSSLELIHQSYLNKWVRFERLKNIHIFFKKYSQSPHLLSEAISFAKETWKLDLAMVNSQSFEDLKQQIEDLQISVYESQRQTPIDEFQHAAENKLALSFVMLKENKIVAMSFSDSLESIKLKGIVDADSSLNQLYMIDTTVDSSFRGQYLATFLKLLINYSAKQANIEEIHGRARWCMAKSMSLINLGVGALESHYFDQIYSDDLPEKGVSYYSLNLKHLSTGQNYDFTQLTKLCLFQNVSLSEFSNLTEKPYYFASSVSEALEKAAKLYFYKHKVIPKIRCPQFNASTILTACYNQQNEYFEFSVGHQIDIDIVERIEQADNSKLFSVVKLGSSCSLLIANSDYFNDAKNLMISTWYGDEWEVKRCLK